MTVSRISHWLILFLLRKLGPAEDQVEAVVAPVAEPEVGPEVEPVGDSLEVESDVDRDNLEGGDRLEVGDAFPVKLRAVLQISSLTVILLYTLSAWTVGTATMRATTDTLVSWEATLTGSALHVSLRMITLCQTQTKTSLQTRPVTTSLRAAQNQLLSKLLSPPTWTHGQSLMKRWRNTDLRGVRLSK